MKLSLGQMAMIARAAGLPGDPDVWAAVGMAESGGDTNVVNSIGCVGIWQINQPAHVRNNPKWTVKWLQNPLNNAIAAKAIYKSQGWNAWEGYTGPDGSGSDGPWKSHYSKGVTSTVPAGWWDDFKKGFSDGWDFGPGPEDFWDDDGFEDDQTEGDYGILGGLEGVSEAIGKTADVLVNPRTWLRVAYGLGGGILILGGLFLMAQKSVGLGKVVNVAKKVASKGSS